MMCNPPSRSDIASHYNEMMGYNSPRVRGCNILAKTCLAALIVLASLTLAGHLAPTHLSWSAVGLGSSYLVIQGAGGKLRERKVALLMEALIAATVITLGCLGGTGVLSGALVSQALLIAILAQGLFFVCCARPFAHHKKSSS